MNTVHNAKEVHLSWLPSTTGSPPPLNAVQADSGICLIRGKIGENLIPGKMLLRNGAASVLDKGKDIVISEFEILCNTNVFSNQTFYNWVPAFLGEVPTGALLAGIITDTNEFLYIARAIVEDEMCIGQVNCSQKFALVSHKGKEYKVKDYDVLCFVKQQN
ncbi:unnamed protein product [Schistosoma turkestanicum]|nr:unnamed protein product [Schistosoma turkestanicum]